MFKTRIKDEKGASAVEFALILPILVVLLFGIAQFGILFNHYLTLTHAAREGVRWAALEKSVDIVKLKIIDASGGLDQDLLDIKVYINNIEEPDTGGATIDDQGSPARVEVAYPVPVLALFTVLFDESDTVTLTGKATQMIE